MGRPPSHGGPTFRFNPNEVAKMEAILQAHNTQMPSREILTSLSKKFSNSPDRSEKLVVQMKQVWNWFQNRQYALRAKTAKVPVKLSVSPATPNNLGAVRNVPQAPPHISVPASPAIVRNIPQVPHPILSASVQNAGQNGSNNSQMEFEAKSARDGAWYDVATFISHRSVKTGDPIIPDNDYTSMESNKEVLVRFAGFGAEEDEWVNIRKHVRQQSLPCESSECVAVLPGDLILCFQEGKDQALYFDAHVLDAQRQRHDVKGCRCRFLVRYDHDQSEEIVPLRKICHRPETDDRMPQLHAEFANRNRNTTGLEPHSGNTVKIYLSPDASQKQQHNAVAPAKTKELPPKAEMPVNTRPAHAPVSHANSSTAMAAMTNAAAAITLPAQTSVPVATSTNITPAVVPVATCMNITPAAHSSVLVATSMNIAPDAQSCVPVATTNIVPAAQSNVPVATSTNIALDAQSSVPVATTDITLAAQSSVPLATSTNITPVSTSTNITPVSTSTNIDAHSNVSGFALSSRSSSTPSVQLIDSGTPVSIVAAVFTVGHSITPRATSSMTTEDANSPASGCAASVVTIRTPVVNSSAVGSTDSSVTVTTSTADYNVHGVAESITTATTPFANFDVSGVSDVVATASAPVASPAPVGASVNADKLHRVDESEVLPESASDLGANEDSQLAEIIASNSTSSNVADFQ